MRLISKPHGSAHCEKCRAGNPARPVLDTARKANTGELNSKIKQYEESLPKDDDLALYCMWRSKAATSSAAAEDLPGKKPKLQCLRCHKNEIGDSQVGPDLTHIGSKKDRDYILESIVYPNKKIAEGFELAMLTLKDNSMVVGKDRQGRSRGPPSRNDGRAGQAKNGDRSRGAGPKARARAFTDAGEYSRLPEQGRTARLGRIPRDPEIAVFRLLPPEETVGIIPLFRLV